MNCSTLYLNIMMSMMRRMRWRMMMKVVFHNVKKGRGGQFVAREWIASNAKHKAAAAAAAVASRR